MGWYHVERKGKGICLGNECKIVFEEERLVPYLLSKAEAMPIIKLPEKEAEDYDEWPVLRKLASLDEYCADCINEQYFFEDHRNYIIAKSMHYCFEKHYGYPFDSFVSLSDYNGDIMIFSNLMWPPKNYNQRLAELTEEKFEKQLQEFLEDITGNPLYAHYPLEICEEYQKW